MLLKESVKPEILIATANYPHNQDAFSNFENISKLGSLIVSVITDRVQAAFLTRFIRGIHRDVEKLFLTTANSW